MPTMETARRSVAKALSWRAVATVITTALVYVATGEAEFAATIGVADTVLKLGTYIAHERLWNRIPYGRERREPEYYI
jgi:uncharacterized membrane protein